MRTAVGVVTGYVFFMLATLTLFAVTGQEPHESASFGFAFVASVYGMVMAFMAGLIAAAIAKNHRASWLVALLMAIAAGASMLRVPAGGSRTTMILALVLMAPLTIVGGRFYRRLRASTTRPQ